MKIICPFCKKNIETESSTIKCESCSNIFPNFNKEYSEDFFADFIDDYFEYIPKIFPYTVGLKMREYFENDLKRIFHAINVANFARHIAIKEKADLNIVVPCGYLHDIGIKNAEKKYNSSAPKYQEIEGPPVAKNILNSMNCSKNLIEEVCDIIAHHHSPKDEETKNFKCLYDADLIVNWIDGIKERNVKKENVEKILHLFYTETGKDLLLTISSNV